MRKIMVIFYCLYVLVLSGCNQTTDLPSTDHILWNNKRFAEAVAGAFGKSLEQVTEQDLEAIITVDVTHEGKESYLTLYTSETIYQHVYSVRNAFKDISDLIHFQNATKLVLFCENIGGLEVCNQMPQLTELELQSYTSQKLLAEVSRLQYIERMSIMFLNLDYSVLSEMSGLELIKLKDSGLRNYIPPKNNEPLKTLPNERILIDIEDLLGRGNYELAATHPNIYKMGWVVVPEGGDIRFLEQMKHLEKLKITGVTDVTSISKMTWLKELSIESAPNVVDFTLLSNLTQLERLYLKTDVQQDFSINQIGTMKNLKEFTLWGKCTSSLDGIERFENLQAFTCYSLLEDISAIKHLRNTIEVLDFSGNIITDLTPLQTLTKLTDLDLSNNEITDISPLRSCVGLADLDLSDNYIFDISPLTGLPKLEELMIYILPKYHDQINLERWHNTLLSLPALRLYCGVEDGAWLSENMPHVRIKTVYDY